MTKTKIETVAVRPPARPEGLVLEKEIGQPLILTMGNVGAMLDEIEAGTKSPINHICWLPRQNEIDKRNRDRLITYIKKWIAYGNEVEARHKELEESKKESP